MAKIFAEIRHVVLNTEREAIDGSASRTEDQEFLVIISHQTRQSLFFLLDLFDDIKASSFVKRLFFWPKAS